MSNQPQHSSSHDEQGSPLKDEVSPETEAAAEKAHYDPEQERPLLGLGGGLGCGMLAIVLVVAISPWVSIKILPLFVGWSIGSMMYFWGNCRNWFYRMSGALLGFGGALGANYLIYALQSSAANKQPFAPYLAWQYFDSWLHATGHGWPLLIAMASGMTAYWFSGKARPRDSRGRDSRGTSQPYTS